jgi:hypothetical protein
MPLTDEGEAAQGDTPMRLYRRGQQQIPQTDLDAAKHIVPARVQAGLRVGESVEARLNWVLTFLQRDLDTLSPGDWLNLCDEIRMYGAPLPRGGSPYSVLDVPKGRTVRELQHHSLLPRAKVRHLQAHLLRLVQDLLAGQPVTTVPLPIRLSTVLHPNRTSIDGTWTGDPLHLLLFRLLMDLQAAEVTRLRRCERGHSTEDQALDVPVCGRWFYARDLRQQYCSAGCGKEGRWNRYWHANREKINRRRRKGIKS